MNARIIIFSLVCLGLAGVVSAQTHTVTNLDLEKYRQQRLQADRDYRENYERLGMPSPNEIEKRLAEKRAEMDRLSDRFRDERLETERVAAEQQAAAEVTAGTAVDSNYYVPQNDGWYYSTGFGWRRSRRFQQFRQPSGYFAGGQFWETPQQRARPIRSPRVEPRRPHR
ncbi:MAG TPA: hypothetical protein VL325_05600 [Pyrinomonadaceae bacterium]|jgi:hypothetical protein|nr:hypothetical protein [Pyrinomonadaceae bacterium]